MNKLITLFLLVSCFLSQAQEQTQQPTDSIPWEIRKQSVIYTMARNMNDPFMERTALYNLLAANPANFQLYDSLAKSYYQYNSFVSAALAAQRSTEINPNNAYAMEIAALSFSRLGAKDKALSYYEKFYLLNNSINTLYSMAFIQYELGRYSESNASLDIILNSENVKNEVVVFPSTDGKGQETTLEIAAMRIKAMILEGQGKKDEALNSFLEILKLQPGLEIIQQQLQELRSAE